VSKIFALYATAGPKTAALLLCMLVSVVAVAAQPFVYQEVFDRAIAEADTEYFMQLIGILVGLLSLTIVTGVARAALIGHIASQIARNLRARMLDRVQRSRLDDLGAISSGDLLARFSNDVSVLENVLLVHGPRLFMAIGSGLLCAGLLFVLHWKLALVTCALLPIAGAGASMLSSRLGNLSDARADHEGELTELFRELIATQPIIRAFSLGARWRRRIDDGADQLFQSARSVGWVATLMEVGTIAGVELVILGVVATGAWFALSGSITTGALVGFFALLMNVAMSAETIGREASQFMKSAGAMAQIDSLITTALPDRTDGTAVVPRLEDGIRLRDVILDYGETRALSGIDLDIEEGSSVALVGPSGSGKSSLLRLLLRFTEPSAGSIQWDGVEFSEASENSMRSHVSVVFQDTALFNVSVAENIRYGKLDATDEAIEAAARAAEIHELIASLPEGYDTLVGAGGGRLSGGQRQRIAIARALVREPAVLLLDEATAALDVETEASINATLAEIAKTTTVVSVTHRLDPIREFDSIVVLDGGRIAERGNHDELIAADGLYRQLIDRQDSLRVTDNGRTATVTPRMLATVPLLSSLTEDERADLCARFVAEHYGPNTEIVREGDPGDLFYILVHGRAVVEKRDSDGNPAVVDQIRDGDYFGEIALLDSSLRTATIRATSPVLVLSLSKQAFSVLLEKRSGLRESLTHTARERAGSTTG